MLDCMHLKRYVCCLFVLVSIVSITFASFTLPRINNIIRSEREEEQKQERERERYRGAKIKTTFYYTTI